MVVKTILPIFPEYRTNGVIRFVRDLYENECFWKKEGFEIINPIGVWFDSRLKTLEEKYPKNKEEAETKNEKEEIKKIFKNYIQENKPDIIHLNLYAIVIDLIRFLMEYKEIFDVKIAYTVHSLAYQDFIRSPEDQKIFNIWNEIYNTEVEKFYIDNNTFFKNVLELSKEFFNIGGDNSEKIKRERIIQILENNGLIENGDTLLEFERKKLLEETVEEKYEDIYKFRKLLIRVYMMALQYYILKNLSDKIICISEFIKESLEKVYKDDIEKEKIYVINNGTDFFDVYDKNKEKIEAGVKKWKEKYHNPQDFIIMYVGRVTSLKGIEDLVYAFQKLVNDEKYLNNVFLYFSGSGANEYFSLLKERKKL